jgi:hypothetical protein
MKTKKSIKKLELRKLTISNLNSIIAGAETVIPLPKNTIGNPDSGCPTDCINSQCSMPLTACHGTILPVIC